LQRKNNIFEIKQIVIDWNHDFWLWKFLSTPIKTIIKWDSKVSYIWFASIAAKVERDAYMSSLWKKYEKYWFAQHKWYGTVAHRKAIKKYWCSELHRQTFCKNIR
jgi:ribonuclease HII